MQDSFAIGFWLAVTLAVLYLVGQQFLVLLGN